MIKKITYGLMIVGAILTLAFILIFVLNFWGTPVSAKIEHWAQFGDYIGGILNPILALVNICVFVILTLTIQDLTDKNNKASIETNKRIAIMSMKHEELTNFKKEMDNNLSFWREDLGDIERIKRVLYGYNVLEYRMMFLFPELRNSDHNRDLRRYIVEALNNHKAGKINEAKHCNIPVSNIYGMLVSDMGEWTVK
jgi:uncharacterized membrane protein